MKTTSWKGVVSFIAGLVGLGAWPLALVALTLGYWTREEISKSEGRIDGGKMATAGIVLGWIGLAAFVIRVCALTMNVSG